MLPTPKQEAGGEGEQRPGWCDQACAGEQRALLDSLEAQLGAAGVQVYESGEGHPADRRGLGLVNGGFIEMIPDNPHLAASLARILKPGEALGLSQRRGAPA